MGEYTKTLRYVQEQLRKHQERATPTPMDIGNLDQNDDATIPHKEQLQQNKKKNRTATLNRTKME